MPDNKLTPREAIEKIRRVAATWMDYPTRHGMACSLMSILSRVAEEEPQRGHEQNCTCHANSQNYRVCGGGEHSHPYRDPRCSQPQGVDEDEVARWLSQMCPERGDPYPVFARAVLARFGRAPAPSESREENARRQRRIAMSDAACSRNEPVSRDVEQGVDAEKVREVLRLLRADLHRPETRIEKAISLLGEALGEGK